MRRRDNRENEGELFGFRGKIENKMETINKCPVRTGTWKTWWRKPKNMKFKKIKNKDKKKR